MRTNVPDRARTRLSSLGPGPPPAREPDRDADVGADVGERVGWPTAPPGTPAARLRFTAGGALPEPPWSSDPADDDFGAHDPWSPPAGDRRGSRWVERWLPASWRGARWDPGRAGAVALAVVAAVAAVVAAVGVWSGRPTAEPVPALPAVSGASSTPSGAPAVPPGGPIVVSVSGKVARPGLVRLPEGSRVGEALAAAGGATPGVDLTGLNLAQRLADGEQVVVGVPVPPPSAAPVPGATPDSGARASSGRGHAAAASGDKVNLNTATLEQLDQLPGVGPVTAQKILDWRTQNGRFFSVEQLQEVGGIGDARLATLRPLVVV